MKVLTILGTRPEIIRLSLLIPKLDKLTNHTLLHTGQNYTPELDSIFFESMKIRSPDINLDVRSKKVFGQIGRILEMVEGWIEKIQPDACLILGDTNSGLSAIVAEKKGVPVFHMEAGNRCHDLSVPEELNRKIIDHSSSWLLPYVESSRMNLLKEGLSDQSIFVTGNPIYEVLEHYRPQIQESQILETLQIQEKEFFLVTAHRQENVNSPERLTNLVTGLNKLGELYGFPVVWSLHPRTRSLLEKLSLEFHPLVKCCAPFDLFDFVKLEQSSFCVLTDSGTVQEECCIFQVPAVTLRDTTERPETIACGSNVLSGCCVEKILGGVALVTNNDFRWQVPREYVDPNVSDKVVRLLFGKI
ncbi:non-hydrolyzing UDP-N-acetylglucosamine 2-epimerase [Candidatus Nitronereus thalassa]|uniref:UDP-N-acetylglucosamine 2-epimerase (Non-hydrolyzing) n=1 Tax=Candidatus Nitronereus thalassa TaxID=3020898 RepID=A0ABU3K5M2_9BACT|nr:UDP-N-acetylglucosamine 2-epimerase (non-hydrolyzing) [Candidatus Nitronereus thalassa]MDT7041648.1 UDP-N-acetylglucosamine 2-epimerase (non-hydrolyzing) [Candidatus Nitronereus thalassa]